MTDLELALELADLADLISLDRYLASDLVVESKSDLTPVSDADKAVCNRAGVCLNNDAVSSRF